MNDLIISAVFTYFDRQLKYEGRAWAEPAGDLIATHDMMDHCDSDTGRVEDEFQALGAGLITRACAPYLSISSVGSDVGHVARRYGRNGIAPAPATVLDEAGQRAYDEMAEEFMHYYTKDAAMMLKAMGWVRAGYVRARERYKGIENVDLKFDMLRAAVTGYMRAQMQWTHARVRFSINLMTEEVTTKALDESDDKLKVTFPKGIGFLPEFTARLPA